MEHDATISDVPFSPTGGLLSGKSILESNSVMGISVFIVEMSVFFIEFLVFIIANPKHPVFHLECILVVLIEWMAGNFDIPTSEVFSIE